MTPPIYLDYAATTPTDRRVLQWMEPYFTRCFGNPASDHLHGREAEAGVEAARVRLARTFNGSSSGVVWTSGATEADNLALKGCHFLNDQAKDIVTVATEHKAVLAPLVSSDVVLGVGPSGLVDTGELARVLEERPVGLVSVMAVNNETGVIQPLRRIGLMCKEAHVLFHVDAAQALGKIPLDVESMCIDLLSVSGHKIYGPKGVGALWVRPGVRLSCQVEGGGQEHGMRSGTLNVPAIVGLGYAAELAESQLDVESMRIERLRSELEARIAGELGGWVNGIDARRAPGISSMTLPGVVARDLRRDLSPWVSFSVGSACQAKNLAPSHVLTAMGLSEREAQGTIRLSVGRLTTEREVVEAAERITGAFQ